MGFLFSLLLDETDLNSSPTGSEDGVGPVDKGFYGDVWTPSGRAFSTLTGGRRKEGRIRQNYIVNRVTVD